VAEDASSEIELMVIGNAPIRELANLLSPPRMTLGREINPVTMRPEQLRQRAQTGDPFLQRLFQEPMGFLTGTEDELRQIAGRGAFASA